VTRRRLTLAQMDVLRILEFSGVKMPARLIGARDHRGPGSLYPILRHLAKWGLIDDERAMWLPDGPGGPSYLIREYVITQRGLDALRDAEANWRYRLRQRVLGGPIRYAWDRAQKPGGWTR
jgi:hypothetical protein